MEKASSARRSVKKADYHIKTGANIPRTCRDQGTGPWQEISHDEKANISCIYCPEDRADNSCTLFRSLELFVPSFPMSSWTGGCLRSTFILDLLCLSLVTVFHCGEIPLDFTLSTVCLSVLYLSYTAENKHSSHHAAFHVQWMTNQWHLRVTNQLRSTLMFLFPSVIIVPSVNPLLPKVC